MDFVEELLTSNRLNIIFVVVDWLTKYAAHFMTIKDPYTAKEIAAKFMRWVFKIHKFPKSTEILFS